MDAQDILRNATFVRQEDIIVLKWTSEFPEDYRDFGMDFTYDYDSGKYDVCIYRGNNVLLRRSSTVIFKDLLIESTKRLALIINKVEKNKLEEQRRRDSHNNLLDSALELANRMAHSARVEDNKEVSK